MSESPRGQAVGPAERSRGGKAGGAVARLKDRLKDGVHAGVKPIVGWLVHLGVTPDQLTVMGLVLSLASGVEFFEGHPGLGALLLAAAGLCDILDGEVARRTGSLSRFGAFLDSTLDRLSDALVLLGIAGFYVSNLLGRYGKASALVEQVASGEVEGPLAVVILRRQPVEPSTWVGLTLLCGLALIGSFLVSYTRARAEGLGLECKVGWFERPERMGLLVIAGLVASLVGKFWAMPAALLLLTVFSFATAAQRVAHVHRITRRAGMDQLGG